MQSYNSIESLFFEFKKMKVFFGIGSGLQLIDFKVALISDIQEYLYSLLLIDLLSIFDEAVRQIIGVKKITIHGRKRIEILEKENLIDSNRASYLKWYKEWRNDAAHRRRKISYSELNQVSNDIENQLLEWNFIRKFDIYPIYDKINDSLYTVGAKIGQQPVLKYEIGFMSNPKSQQQSTAKVIDITLSKYLELIKS